ncbi:MAG: ABC transporter permease [Deltaproteobacteria bacterium]|nr:ABC transporter permease [Deltaproteobacteria bacterium]
MSDGAFTLARSLLHHLVRRDVPLRRALAAADATFTGSFLLVCAAVGFVGASLCWQAAWQARRVLGDQGFIGPEYLVLMTTEFAPLMVGVMMAARGGAGLAARIATRKATGQLDALALMGEDPLRVLAAPDVLGAFLAAVLLAPPALVVGELAGAVTMKLAFSVEPATFIVLDALRAGDITFALIKAALFGAAVTLLGARAGLRARPDASGVGEAAMRGVVDGSLGVLVLDAVLDALRFTTGFP